MNPPDDSGGPYKTPLTRPETATPAESRGDSNPPKSQ